MLQGKPPALRPAYTTEPGNTYKVTVMNLVLGSHEHTLQARTSTSGLVHWFGMRLTRQGSSPIRSARGQGEPRLPGWWLE